MKEQDYQWVKKCIESCNDDWQLQTAWELITLFEKKYDEGLESNSLHFVYLVKQSLIKI